MLRGCDLDVAAGDVHAIVGGNGCGKSTLLRAAAGVLKSERGRVANRPSARQALLRRIEGTLRMRYGSRGAARVAGELRLRRRRRRGRARALRPGRARRRHPYDLSGGQQQLLAFAKLLLTDPTCCCSTSRRRGSTRRRSCWSPAPCAISRRPERPSSSPRTT
ncbi:MAG: ATP-binding cassette domain-containing protein [Eggerthella lenta]